MMRQSSPPCRLGVIFARKAPVGVIFRRGPSKWVQLIKWNTREDTFEEGQWFHGRIYEERSDLSPSGDFLIYFASKFNQRTLKDREYTYAWTAISRPPFLTALALWPKGDCWQGGGFFVKERQVFLNHPAEAAEPHPDHRPKDLGVMTIPKSGVWTFPKLLYRTDRNEWTVLQRLEYDYLARRTIQPELLEKENRKGNWKLQVERYLDPEERWICSLVSKQGKAFSIGIGTWVDFDQAGRVTFASDGKLFAVNLSNGKVGLTELADFNNSKPRNLKAPDWATRW
jgi:hypothetical protein